MFEATYHDEALRYLNAVVRDDELTMESAIAATKIDPMREQMAMPAITILQKNAPAMQFHKPDPGLSEEQLQLRRSLLQHRLGTILGIWIIHPFAN